MNMILPRLSTTVWDRSMTLARIRTGWLSFAFAFLLLTDTLGTSLVAIQQSDTTESHRCRSASQQDKATRRLNGSTSLAKLEPAQCKSSDPEVQAEWRWNYVEENVPGYKILVREDSLDARMVNTIYTANSIRQVNTDWHKVNQIDQETNLQYSREAAGLQVNEPICRQELSKMLYLIEELANITNTKRNGRLAVLEERHVRLARVLDSFGRYQGGGLLGLNYHFGHVDQCTSTDLELGLDLHSNTSATRYCVAKLSIDRNLDPDLASRKRTEFEPQPMIVVGICIPMSCHMISFPRNKQLIQRLVDSQFQLPRDLFVQTNPEIESIYCSPDSDSQLARISLSGQLYLAFVIIWMLTLVFITLKLHLCYKNKRFSPNGYGIIWFFNHAQESLNIKESVKDLVNTATRHSTSKVRLEPLDMLKVISCGSVVLVHTLVMFATLDSNPLQTANHLELKPLKFVLLLGLYATDCFFIITGIVVTFTSLKKLNRRWKIKTNRGLSASLKEILYILMTRYLRLVPVYMFVFLGVKSLFTGLSSGPLWDDGLNIDTEFGACRHESWSTPLTGMSSQLSLFKQCLPQAWSVGLDILFTFIMSPLIVLIARKPLFGSLLSACLAMVSLLSVFIATTQIHPSTLKVLSEMKFYGLVGRFEALNFIYTGIIYRAYAFLIGIITGLILYHYAETGKIRDWPGWFKGLATKLSLLFIVAIKILPFAYAAFRTKESSLPGPMELLLFMAVIDRLLWCLSNAVIMLRLMTDWKEGFLARHSSNKFWSIMVKLNYCILLTHMHVLVLDVASASSRVTFSKTALISSFVAIYMKSVVAAIFLFVLVENPIQKVVKGVIDRMFLGQNQRDMMELNDSGVVARVATLDGGQTSMEVKNLE